MRLFFIDMCNTWRDKPDGKYDVECARLAPGEVVVNRERVKELVASMEADAIIRGGQALMERWGELKKELGIE